MLNYNDLIFKISIIGPTSIGKSSLITRYIKNKFINLKETIGADYFLKNIHLDPDIYPNINIALNIWDIAGNDRFLSSIPLYLVGSDGIILSFSSTSTNGILELNKYIKFIEPFFKYNTPIILVSTKNDLVNHCNLKYLNIEKFINKNHIIKYFPTSALNNYNIEIVFNYIINLLLLKHHITPTIIN